MNNRSIKWLLVGLLGIAVVVCLVSAGAYFWFQYTVSNSQPTTDGRMAVTGILAPVEIVRDVYGVPHITAHNEPDLFFGFGYAMAQDRLWQMDLYRRVGAGRLSEVLGPEALEVDRYFRTLAAARRNRPLPRQLVFMIDAFASGINAYIENRGDRLPLEFKLLGYRPESWQREDYFDVYTLISWGLSLGWKTDLVAAEMLQKVAEEKFREAFPTAGAMDLPIVNESRRHLPARFSATKPVADAVARLTGISPGPASNNWVISGTRSATGKPLLANDTHMALTNPSIWWEVHLICPTIDAAGFAIPGLPSVPVGRNRHAAWGVTNVMVDDVDFYIEQRHPQDPLMVRNEDRWEKMTTRVERIRVKGADPVDVEAQLTRHGPVIASSESDPAIPVDKVIAARWTFLELDVPAQAAYGLLKAESAADVVAALRAWQVPGQNFVFADTHGSIGYWCSAAIPIRPNGNGLLPLPGWTGTNDWIGFIAFDQLPHAIDPQDGYIASANNPVTGDGYPHVIGTYWEPLDRISRIRRLIETKPRLSVEDMMHMQSDIVSPLVSELAGAILRVLDQQPAKFADADIRDTLHRWDFRMARDSAAAALVETTYLKLLENIFKDELGADLYNKYIGLSVFAPRALWRILTSGHSAWLDDTGTPAIETQADLIEKSLQQALTDLRKHFGPKPHDWAWGRMHTLTFTHILGDRKPLNRIFDLGPFQTPGNHLTVNKKQYDYRAPFGVKEGVSQRMIVDLAAPQTALHVLPTGQSGLIGNRHYRDQLDLYLEDRYHPSWLNRSDIDRHREARLMLTPAERSRF